jgi:hypothetical protein
MSSTLVYRCAIPSTLRGNGVKPTTEMTILPLGSHQSLPPPFSFLLPILSLPQPAPAPPSLPSELEGGAPATHARGTPRPHRRFPGAPQAGSPELRRGAALPRAAAAVVPARGSSAATECRCGRAAAAGLARESAAGCRSGATPPRTDRRWRAPPRPGQRGRALAQGSTAAAGGRGVRVPGFIKKQKRDWQDKSAGLMS